MHIHAFHDPLEATLADSNTKGKLKKVLDEKGAGSTGGQRLEIVLEANGWK